MLTVMNSTSVFGDFENLEIKKSETCNKCLDLEAELVKRKNTVERDDKSCENQNAPEVLEYIENNNLKARLQEKDTTINKLKNHIKSLRESDKKDRVKQDMDVIETINIELEHTALQNELRRLKGKNILDNATTITNGTTIAPVMFKLDLKPLSPKLLNNKEAHIHYLKTTKDQADIFME
ncbi:hypothetical protein Tco_0961323 [Tanacetum coccineum]